MTLGATQVLSYLEEPKQQERIDVVMGLDEILFARAKQYLYPLNPVEAKYQPLIAPRAKDGFYPTDHAALSMIYKKSEFGSGKLPVPKKLADLLDPKLKGKFIVQDPRVSSPGMWFFLFADQIVKTEALSKQWLSVSPSWDASYKMFIAGEAPMVWSYVTSLAYHASQKQGDQYAHVEFEEGLPIQVEGMGVLNRTGNPYQAKPCVQKWVEFVLSPEAQTKLADAQWMLPAVAAAKVPEFLSMVPTPKKAAVMNLSIEHVDSLVSHFGRAASR
jgi:thiamine transport system substrate-binding protein